MRHRFLLLFAVCTCDFALAGAPSDAILPFELRGHLIVVRAQIGDLKDIELAIDTGSFTTIISPRLARRLGLEADRERDVLVLGHRMKIKEVELPGLCLRGNCYGALRAYISPLHTVPVDGLLGFEVLRTTSFSIDFDALQMQFGGFEPFGSAQRSAPQLPFLVTRLTVGTRTLSLLLDTGCGEILIFGRRVGDSLPMERSGRKVRLDVPIVSVTAEMVTLEEATLGKCRWKNLRAFRIDDRQTDRYGTLDGILGPGVMNLRRLGFDATEHRVFWEQR